MYDNPDRPKTHTVYLVFQVAGYPQNPWLTLIEKVVTEYDAEQLIMQLTDLSRDSVGNASRFKYLKAEVVK